MPFIQTIETMSAKKQKQEPFERYTFTNEEIQRLKCQLELSVAQAEVIGLLNANSASFADWSVIISEAVHETMAKKQQMNKDCKKELKMLENISFMFIKLASHKKMLSDWHRQLIFGNKLTKQMIKDGHP